MGFDFLLLCIYCILCFKTQGLAIILLGPLLCGKRFSWQKSPVIEVPSRDDMMWSWTRKKDLRRNNHQGQHKRRGGCESQKNSHYESWWDTPDEKPPENTSTLGVTSTIWNIYFLIYLLISQKWWPRELDPLHKNWKRKCPRSPPPPSSSTPPSNLPPHLPK